LKVIYYTSKYEIVQTHRNYVVRRKSNHGGTYEQHSHFKKLEHAKSFLKIIDKGLMPRSQYWMEAARRIMSEDEFNNLKR